MFNAFFKHKVLLQPILDSQFPSYISEVVESLEICKCIASCCIEKSIVCLDDIPTKRMTCQETFTEFTIK